MIQLNKNNVEAHNIIFDSKFIKSFVLMTSLSNNNKEETILFLK